MTAMTDRATLCAGAFGRRAATSAQMAGPAALERSAR